MLLSESVRAPLNPGEARRQVPSHVDAVALARRRDLAYSHPTMIQLEPTHTDKHPELGHLLWTLDGHYVVGLAFSQEAPPARIDYDDAESDEPQPLPGYPAGLDAINAFLGGDEWALRRLPHRLSGTPFQFAVWQTVASIQRGTTMSYGEIAQELKRPKAARAVGQALGQNPLPLFYPCHRVIGSEHNLVGFTGGMPLKEKLLQKEGAILI